MVVWGGVSATDPVNDMWRYNINSRRWEKRPQFGQIPPSRFDFAFASTSTMLFVFGGYVSCDDGGSRYSNELWRFEFQTSEWLKLPMTLSENLTQGPVGRVGHSMTLLGDKLILFGGKGENDNFLSDTWAYSLTASRWSNLSSPADPRRFHSAVQMGTSPSSAREMLIFGGLSPADTALNSLLYYNSRNDTWELIEAGGSPFGRFRHTALWRETNLYVFGGQSSDAGQYLDDMWVYYPESKLWEKLAMSGAKVSGIVSVSAVFANGRGIFVGGLSLRDSNQVLEFNFPEKSWSRKITIGHLPVARIMQSGNVIDDRLWVFGGETADGQKLNDLWDFHLENGDWTPHLPTPQVELETDCAETKWDAFWPSMRSGHASTTDSASSALCHRQSVPLILFGGATESEALNDIWFWCSSNQTVSVNTNCKHLNFFFALPIFF